MKSSKYLTAQQGILSTFKKTISKLSKLNEEISKEEELKKKEREELNVEIEALGSLKKGNDVLKQKFEGFITTDAEEDK